MLTLIVLVRPTIVAAENTASRSSVRVVVVPTMDGLPDQASAPDRTSKSNSTVIFLLRLVLLVFVAVVMVGSNCDIFVDVAAREQL